MNAYSQLPRKWLRLLGFSNLFFFSFFLFALSVAIQILEIPNVSEMARENAPPLHKRHSKKASMSLYRSKKKFADQSEAVAQEGSRRNRPHLVLHQSVPHVKRKLFPKVISYMSLSTTDWAANSTSRAPLRTA